MLTTREAKSAPERDPPGRRSNMWTSETCAIRVERVHDERLESFMDVEGLIHVRHDAEGPATSRQTPMRATCMKRERGVHVV